LAASTISGYPASSASGSTTKRVASFDITALIAGRYHDAGSSLRAGANPAADQGLRVLRLGQGTVALVDTSLVAEGFAMATDPSSVALSWLPRGGARGHTVFRDGSKVAALGPGASSFRDESVRPGATYRYTVSPTATPAPSVAPVWSASTTIPRPKSGEKITQTLARQAAASAAAARAAATTTLTWVTFIPQAKIDAPPAGCSYRGGYQFGGDNRSYDWRSSRYRTALHAVVTWSNKSVAGHKSVRSTTVYRKSTGALVATRTASTSKMEARKLGSGSNFVDIRMVNHATNPFCSVGAIDGAITIKLTQSGSWSIRSGNHRQMPNHHLYIYNGGRVTDVYRRNYAHAGCLVGSATCPLANLTGYYGRYS
jgi:hypothetical protein